MSEIILNYFALLAATFALTALFALASNVILMVHYGCGFTATIRHFAADVARGISRGAMRVAIGAAAVARAFAQTAESNGRTTVVDMRRLMDAGNTRVSPAVAAKIAATDGDEFVKARTAKLAAV